jgi:gas vesicle protein
MGQNNDSNGAFVAGLITGTLVGAALGTLFAPRRGDELRGQMAESAANVGNAVTKTATDIGDAVSKTVDSWSQRGREVYERGRDAAAQASDQVTRAASEAAKSAESTINSLGDTAAAARRREQSSGRG